MKLRSTKLRLLRFSDVLLPCVFLASAAFDRSDAILTAYIYMLTARLLGLSSPFALRAAFARQPSMRGVRGSVKTAAVLQLGGALLAPLLLLPLFGWQANALFFSLSAWVMNFECICYEYLFAAGERYSAVFLRVLTCVLTGAGLFTVALTGRVAALAICAGLSAMVGVVVALLIGGTLKGPWNIAVIQCAPPAMLRDALFPALAIPALRFLWPDIPSAAPFFAGLALYALYQTPFRRSSMEAEPMNVTFLFVMLAAAIAFALAQVPPIIARVGALPTRYALAVAAMTALAVGCSFVTNGHIRGKDA